MDKAADKHRVALGIVARLALEAVLCPLRRDREAAAEAATKTTA